MLTKQCHLLKRRSRVPGNTASGHDIGNKIMAENINVAVQRRATSREATERFQLPAHFARDQTRERTNETALAHVLERHVLSLLVGAVGGELHREGAQLMDVARGGGDGHACHRLVDAEIDGQALQRRRDARDVWFAVLAGAPQERTRTQPVACRGIDLPPPDTGYPRNTGRGSARDEHAFCLYYAHSRWQMQPTCRKRQESAKHQHQQHRRLRVLSFASRIICY